MKREIKFRAWASNDDYPHGKMYFPGDDFVLNLNGDLIHIKSNGDFNYSAVFARVGYNDINLMQFTGLKDKNGKEIYENDILLFTDDEGSQWNGQVIFHNLSWMVKLFKTEQQVISPDLLSEYSDPDYVTFEVIGNIYEHKHLLQDEK